MKDIYLTCNGIVDRVRCCFRLEPTPNSRHAILGKRPGNVPNGLDGFLGVV